MPSNSVAVTLTVTGVAAGGEKLSMVSLDTAATAKLLKPPLRRKSRAQHHPSLGGSRLALHAQAQPGAPQAPPCAITLRAVLEANIGGAVSPEADVVGGDRMGWVHRVWECARPALFAPSPGLRRQRFFPARARPFQPSGRPLTAVLRRLGAEAVAV